MRVALISDLHANLIALDAVLADIDAVGVDALICLGDIADLGPSPSQTVARVRELGCPTIKGNHDPFDGHAMGPPPLGAVTRWCQQQLSDADLTFLRGLPMHHPVDLGHGRRLLCVHGSPRSYDEGLVAEMNATQLVEVIAGHEVDIICGGHTHVQMLRRHQRTLVVNVGSVGAAFAAVFTGGTPTLLPWAEYAVVEATATGIAVDLRRVDYDVAAFAQVIRDSGLPKAEQWSSRWYT